MLASIPGIPLWIAILAIVLGGFTALAASGFKRALGLIGIAAGVLACFHPPGESSPASATSASADFAPQPRALDRDKLVLNEIYAPILAWPYVMTLAAATSEREKSLMIAAGQTTHILKARVLSEIARKRNLPHAQALDLPEAKMLQEDERVAIRYALDRPASIKMRDTTDQSVRQISAAIRSCHDRSITAVFQGFSDALTTVAKELIALRPKAMSLLSIDKEIAATINGISNSTGEVTHVIERLNANNPGWQVQCPSGASALLEEVDIQNKIEESVAHLATTSAMPSRPSPGSLFLMTRSRELQDVLGTVISTLPIFEAAAY